MEIEEFIEVLGDDNNMFIAKQNLEMIRIISEKIKMLENYILSKADLKPEFKKIMTVNGIGKILVHESTGVGILFRKNIHRCVNII